MNYTLKQSNRKTIAIRVVDGAVIVYAPYGVPLSVVDGFIKEKSQWIHDKLSLHRKIGIDVFNDKTAYIFGSRRTIVWQYATGFSITLTSKDLQVSIPQTYSVQRVNRLLEEWLKKELDHLIQPMIHHVCMQLDIASPAYTIRKYKRLYGRCSSKGTLGFNTYLYHESHEFINYVVVHECAHLIEFSHSKHFYEVVASVMPDYKAVIARQKHERLLDRDQ